MKFKKEITIGLLIVMSLIIGYVGLSFLKGINVFSKSNVYYTSFKDLNNVAIATPVKISGYKVGSVTKVNFDYDKGQGAVLELSINPDVIIHNGSIVKMAVNPLSGSELFIVPPEKIDGTKISVGDSIPSEENTGDIIKLVTKTVMPMITEIIPSINQTVKRINNIAEDKSIDEALLSLENAAKNIEILTLRLNDVSRSLPQIMTNVDSISSNALAITQEMQKIKVDSLMKSVNDAALAISHVSTQLKEKNNTAGLLINDTRIYYRLDSLITSADSLINDVKAHPRKYINLSIF